MADLPRRSVLTGTAAVATMLLSGCDRLSRSPRARQILDLGEDADLFVQRLLLSPTRLAPEFPESAISAYFKPNGSTDPDTADYRKLVSEQFASYRLAVKGLVETPASHSLQDLRAMPARTQITKHDCVEGWSCIGKWTGVQLAVILQAAKLKPEARYVVFRCADVMEAGGGLEAKPVFYYESIDLVDAVHPQTILAYDMNDAPLPVAHGAPLRLRVERQLGYKSAKYVLGLDVVASLDGIGEGHGGYWEDRGYAWYAGI